AVGLTNAAVVNARKLDMPIIELGFFGFARAGPYKPTPQTCAFRALTVGSVAPLLPVPGHIDDNGAVIGLEGIRNMIDIAGIDIDPTQRFEAAPSRQNAKARAIAVAPDKRHRPAHGEVDIEYDGQIHEDDVA